MDFVTYEQQGQIGIITINRPQALNALNSQVLVELDATFAEVDTGAIRCLVLTGAGEKSFVAGADIGEMRALDKAAGEAFGKAGNDVFRKIETFAIPVLAAVNGFALGGGCELAMSCDIRICSDNAIFGQPEVGLGITPGFGGTQRLARLVGAGRAKEMIFAAANIKADEACRLAWSMQSTRRPSCCRQHSNWLAASPATRQSPFAPVSKPSMAVCRLISSRGWLSKKNFSAAVSRPKTRRGHGRFSGKTQSRSIQQQVIKIQIRRT